MKTILLLLLSCLALRAEPIPFALTVKPETATVRFAATRSATYYVFQTEDWLHWRVVMSVYARPGDHIVAPMKRGPVGFVKVEAQ